MNVETMTEIEFIENELKGIRAALNLNPDQQTIAHIKSQFDDILYAIYRLNNKCGK